MEIFNKNICTVSERVSEDFIQFSASHARQGNKAANSNEQIQLTLATGCCSIKTRFFIKLMTAACKAEAVGEPHELVPKKTTWDVEVKAKLARDLPTLMTLIRQGAWAESQ